MSDDKYVAEALNAIRAGKIPLDQVHKAMRAVLEAGTAGMEWVLDLDAIGITGLIGPVTAASMTLGELKAVAEATGVGWESINPIEDVTHAHAVLVALCRSRVPQLADIEAATSAADKVPAGVFNDAYGLREQRPADPS